MVNSGINTIRLLLVVLLCGCQHHQFHDPSLGKAEAAYEQELTASSVDPIPEFRPRAAHTHSPVMLKPLKTRIQGVLPIAQAATLLAEATGVRIQLAKDVRGDVYVQTKDRNLLEVVDDMCASQQLVYRVQGNRIQILPDKPYSETYNLQFLNAKRQNDSALNIGTDIFSSGGDDKQPIGQNNGSATKITASATTDFWHEVEDNLKTMLINEAAVAGTEVPEKNRFTLHKQAGLLTVHASHAAHQQVRDYFRMLKENIGVQVVIEAKIIEVNLNEQYSSGIDWYALKKHFAASAPMGGLAHPGGLDTGHFAARNVITLGGYGKNISGLLHMLSTFGTVRTLSNPRMTALNNHPALLKVATNHVYFKVHYNREFHSDGKAGLERASSQVHTVPVGLILSVHPAVNFETGMITLGLRPTISRIVDSVEDPAVGILTGNAKTSRVPVVQMREMDSVVQVKSGGVVILGGLMEERSDNRHSTPPVPGFSKILKAKDDVREITELVIILRAYVLGQENGAVAEADRRLYEKFTKDPRKIAL